jgi:hypothetical protein
MLTTNRGAEMSTLGIGSDGLISMIQMHPLSRVAPLPKMSWVPDKEGSSAKTPVVQLPLIQISVDGKEHSKLRRKAILDPRNGTDMYRQLPATILQAISDNARQQRLKLLFGSEQGASPQNAKAEGKASVFEAVSVALPLAPPILDHTPISDSNDHVNFEEVPKNIAATQELTKLGKKCVVYGLGIATNSEFESKMANLGCETHAFDCSISSKSPAVFKKPFTFHHWCIGKKDKVSFKGNWYVENNAGNQDDMQFKSLSETMELLGHDHISLLKFDIEGFEWGLFENEILKSHQLPEQLAFELHTAGANPTYVPKENTEGKDYVAVNRLFLKLFDKGYRVISKEVNSGDHACAEFVLMNVD